MTLINPFTTNPVKALHFAILVQHIPFLIFDIRVLWRSGLSSQMSKLKNGGLDQYSAGPYKQQQLGTNGIEWVNNMHSYVLHLKNTHHMHHDSTKILCQTSQHQKRNLDQYMEQKESKSKKICYGQVTDYC